MGIKFSYLEIVSCVLLVLLFSRGSSSRKINYIQRREALDIHHSKSHDQAGHGLEQGFEDDHLLVIKQRKEVHHHHPHPHHPSSHMDHRVDPSDNIFFTMDDLKVGKTMQIYFSNKDPSTSPRLLPREEADSVPFSLAQLPYLLDFFSYTNDSPQAKALEYTLSHCEGEAMEGETKFCATSLESLLDSAQATLGSSDANLKVLTTKFLSKKPTRPLHNYTILEEPKEIIAPKMVGCHTMPYPYVVYYCHSQKGGNRVFEILLGGVEDGEIMVKAPAVCHMDTSLWDKDNVSFRILKIKPGTSPVCHFIPADNLVWVTSNPVQE